MIHSHRHLTAEAAVTNFSIPLLDDGFDVSEEEVLDDSELHSYTMSNYNEEEEVSL